MMASITSQVTADIARHGITAVFVIMALDALLPAGGELTMLLAGALAAGAITAQPVSLLGATVGSGLEAYLVLATAGTLGYLAGSLVGWAIGRSGGRPLIERHGRRLHVGPERFQRAERWFACYGSWTVFAGRLTPVVRSFISIPAGVLGSPLPSYALLTLFGSAIWCFGFAGLGWAVGSSYSEIHHAFRYVDLVAIALAVVAIAAAARIRWRRRSVA